MLTGYGENYNKVQLTEKKRISFAEYEGEKTEMDKKKRNVEILLFEEKNYTDFFFSLTFCREMIMQRLIYCKTSTFLNAYLFRN